MSLSLRKSAQKDFLPLWTIYFNPSDFPGFWVVREQRVLHGGLLYKMPIACVCSSLEEARRSVPIALHRIERDPMDDSVIVETWL